eukprot:5923381-Amphidinium_carterae.1
MLQADETKDYCEEPMQGKGAMSKRHARLPLEALAGTMDPLGLPNQNESDHVHVNNYEGG